MGTHASARSRGDVDDVRRVLDAVRRIVRVLRLSAVDAERALGLSAAQLFVLQKLGDGKPVSVNELAERTHTHQSSVSVVVQRLVDRRLVRRARSVVDGRRAELSITPAGLRKLRAAPAAAQDRLIDSLARMRGRDRKMLAELLELFAHGAGADAGVPGLFFEEEPKAAQAGRVGLRRRG